MRLRRGAVVCCLASVMVWLAGCGGGPGSSSASDTVAASSPPEVSATPQLDLLSGKEFPIEAYELTPEKMRQLNNAQSALANTCLARFGFDPVLRPMPAPTAEDPQVSRRYGVTDPVAAKQSGYHPPQQVITQRPPTGDDPSPELMLVLHGGPGPGSSGQTYNGKAVPTGGCLGEAKRALHGDVFEDSGAMGFVAQLEISALRQSTADRRVTAKFAEWSSCMAGKGYQYSDIFAPTADPAIKSSLASPHASATEIQTAVADVECKRSVNLIGVWYAVEVAYQDELIAQNQERLSKIASMLDDMLQAAAAVRT